MDRNHLDDFPTDNENPNSLISSTRRTPGKFNDGDSIGKFDDVEKTNCNVTMNNFYLYPTNIDTNAIWKTNKDIQRSYSMPSESNDISNQDILSNIWNSKKESSNNEQNHINDSQNFMIGMTPISVAVSNYEGDYMNQSSLINASSINGTRIQTEEEKKIVNDENKKIFSMINSHDGWGVKPINQKTPWEIPEVSASSSDGYPDTFSSWLNDTPNGAAAWETYEATKSNNITSTMPPYGSAVQPSLSTQKSWATMSNDNSSWSQMSALNGPNCVSKPITNGYKVPEPPNTLNFNSSNRLLFNRMQNDSIKKNLWLQESKSMTDFQNVNTSSNADGIMGQRSRILEVEMQRCKLYKDAQRQMTQEYMIEQQKLMEIERNISSISTIPNPTVNSRNIISELARQHENSNKKINLLKVQIESVRMKILHLEDEMFRENSNNTHQQQQQPSTPTINSSPITSPTTINPTQNPMFNMDMITNKMGFMRVNSTQDFRLDVPEFIPGKKWYGLNQNGKENRVPTQQTQQQPYNCNTTSTNFNINTPISLNTPHILPNNNNNNNNSNLNNLPMSESNNTNNNPNSYYWLLIQNLPSHVNVDMVQSFFNQHNTPFVSPLHCNPFSRWMLIKFHNALVCQKAYQLLSGKIGQVTLISDHEANMRLQELKGVMANFVAHQN